MSNPFATIKTPNISLDAAGLVALADLSTLQARTALTGTSTLLDLLVLCPGIHLQQTAVDLNNGEYPACGAMTSGYVFRVENPATVYWLQNIGKTGHLTDVEVSKLNDDLKRSTWLASMLFSFHNSTMLSGAAYFAAVLWGTAVLILLGMTGDWWGLTVVLLLMFSRLCNIIIIRRRSKIGWKGAEEPGVKSDLIILLSQDRWIRMRGDVDDVKAVTSGQWLRDETSVESWITAFATIVIYFDAALASNVKQFGKILLLALLIGSVTLLAIVNAATKDLLMHGRIVKVVGKPKSYGRRKDLAQDLINQSGRDDWAIRMAMIVKESPTDVRNDGHQAATM